MANFVLVHGAWHGGWCWRDVAGALRAQGHAVFTPTHTGVGERAHQHSEAITLETHIRDVCGCIEAEELDDVVLCGHSYGGFVITGVADRLADRVKALAYLDAFVPQNGQSLNGILPMLLPVDTANTFIGAFRGAALENRSGMTQPIQAEMFNVVPDKRAWVDRRCVPQALATFEMPLLLTGAGDAIRQRVYMLANGWDPSPFRYYAARFDSQPGWRVVRFPCGHDVMVDMPQELAQELLKLA
jgi:pimeloyl-ACP methyl ester carboxylesterase